MKIARRTRAYFVFFVYFLVVGCFEVNTLSVIKYQITFGRALSMEPDHSTGFYLAAVLALAEVPAANPIVLLHLVQKTIPSWSVCQNSLPHAHPRTDGFCPPRLVSGFT